MLGEDMAVNVHRQRVQLYVVQFPGDPRLIPPGNNTVPFPDWHHLGMGLHKVEGNL